MYQWQPSKWIKWSPIMAGLPFLAGAWLQTPGLVNDVSQRAMAAAGDWAKVEFDGRDAKLSGTVTSQEALDAAKKSVLETYGVRTLDVTNVKIAEPVALAAPTIESLTTNQNQPTITGTWPQDVAKTLAVSVNNKTYKFGTDAELTSDAGKWSLKPSSAIPDGAYDVTAEVSDGGKMVTASAAPGKLLIDTVPPIVPTISPPATDAKWPYAISGSWPEAAGAGLAVKLLDKTYTLGKDEALKSDGKGTFTFDPRVDLKPGTYDLNFTLNDAVGNVTPFAAPGAIVIPEVKVEAPPPKPAPKPAPVPLAPPTVMSQTTNNATTMIEGTYPAEASKLMVDVDGKTYTLGQDKELTKAGEGKWMLMPANPLGDGEHKVTAKVENTDGTASSGSAPTPVVIDTVPPAAPALNAVAADSTWPYAITGSWPEGDAKNLSAEFNGKSYELGSKELISDGKGKFTFLPSDKLDPGRYDLSLKVADALNNITTTVVKEAVIIAAPPPPPPPPPPPEPVKIVLTAPTIEKQVSDKGDVVVKGTWAAGIAKSLAVTLAGKTYALGKDFALLTDAAGHWTLKPEKPLADGSYDIVAEVGDGAGATMKDASDGELVVKIPPPPAPKPAPKPAPAPVAKPAPAPAPEMKAPTVEASKSDSDKPTVKGTWNAGVAKGLTVSLDGVGYKLGKDYALLTDPAGHWTLKPTKPLVNGTYDVIAEESDGAGKTLRDATKDELTINVAPPPPAPPAAQPYDCEGTMARISAVFPVRFDFNKDGLKAPFDLSVNQYAALMKDPRCLALKVEVEGHADYIGSEKYNQGLSERRAATVIDALTKGGIDVSRLTAKGFSKDKPLDPATNDTARMKNRRVEFTVSK
jgi:outer membrane protein OmpA-like peptidoglycan-associated protein